MHADTIKADERGLYGPLRRQGSSPTTLMDLARHHAAAVLEADRVARHFGQFGPDGDEASRIVMGLAYAWLHQQILDGGHTGDDALRLVTGVAMAGATIAREAARR